MSRREREPLTPEERDIAQRLARLDSGAAPAPGLDARILAAAQAAAEAPAARPVAPARRRRPRWPVGMGIAASLVVAVGVAWQLRPQPDSVALDAPSEAALSRTRVEPAPTAAAVDVPAAAAAHPIAKERTDAPSDPAAPASVAVPQPEPAAAAARAMTSPVERERSERAAQLAREAATRQAEDRQAQARETEQAATRQQAGAQDAGARDAAARPAPRAATAAPPVEAAVESERLQLPPPAPPAPPAAAARAPEFVPPPPPAQPASPAPSRAVPPPDVATPITVQTQERRTRAQAVPPARDSIEVTGSHAAPPAAAVDALADQPLDDRPPASADSPAVRERWLQRIRELRDGGQHDAARDSLREFVRRHPQARLPDDLRPLLEE